MHVGVINFQWPSPNGLETTAREVYKIFSENNVLVDHIMINGTGEVPKGKICPWGLRNVILNYRKGLTERLREYDCLFLAGSGPYVKKPQDDKVYRHIIDSGRFFVVHIGGEHERRVLGNFDAYITSDMCKGVTFSSANMCEFFKDLIGGRHHCFRQVMFYTPEDFPAVDYPTIEMRPSVISSTCRVVPIKGIHRLVDLSSSLLPLGLSFKIHGSSPLYFYKKSLQEAIAKNNTCSMTGSFRGEDVWKLLVESRYHYNFLFRKRPPIYPRVECATMEAMMYGCIPIVCDDTSPDWMKDNSICVKNSEFDTLPKRLEEVEKNLDRYPRLLMDGYKNLVSYCGNKEFVDEFFTLMT